MYGVCTTGEFSDTELFELQIVSEVLVLGWCTYTYLLSYKS